MQRERDIAFEHGPKACQSLEGMVERRADEYFRILIPRFGGFNAEPVNEGTKQNDQISGEGGADNNR